MRALITGVSGQDGSYLAELLLGKGYEVHGIIRRSSVDNLERLDGFADRLTLHYGDLADAASLLRIVEAANPDEVYNLAALSDVRVSFDTAVYSGDVTGLGAARLLEAVRQVQPDAHYYQAGSSEMFGVNPDVPTDETARFAPASPYAAAKVYAHAMTELYRAGYGLHASNGVLFNHESPRRGLGFVTRKISRGLADIVHGRADELVLGNIDAKRDWGHARDFVRAMWLMLQQDTPDDYVIATGETRSVREFLDAAFGYADLDWQDYVRIDPRYFRPVDPPVLLGDAGKARRVLGWEPEVGFDELVRLMVEADLA